ncbi:MAG: hypothetical protein KKH88_04920 [Nanoarchaeota archaeon]|nr:hypothetical protein [Nanoarchaeota archaeon]
MEIKKAIENNLKQIIIIFVLYVIFLFNHFIIANGNWDNFLTGVTIMFVAFAFYLIVLELYTKNKIKNKKIASKNKLIKFKHDSFVASQHSTMVVAITFIIASIPFFVNKNQSVAFLLLLIAGGFALQSFNHMWNADKYSYWYIKKFK